MTTPNIYTNLEKVVHTYIESLSNYTDTAFTHKKDPETWSLAQMYEHLLISSNFFFLANTLRCLEQRKGQVGGEKNANGENLYKYGGFPPIKIKMPNAIEHAPEEQSKEVYLTGLQKILSDSQQLVAAIDTDAGEYKTNHPALGFLNAREWFWNMEMHFRHHLRQKSELEAFAQI